MLFEVCFCWLVFRSPLEAFQDLWRRELHLGRLGVYRLFSSRSALRIAGDWDGTLVEFYVYVVLGLL